jgi:hypothetical protein
MRRGGLIGVAVAVAAATLFCSPALASSVTQLPFAGGGWMAVDGEHEHVFVSGGAGTSSIVVLDFDGTIVTTIVGQPGASGMVVDESSDTLYVALRDATAISRIDTVALTETSRMSVAPLSLPTNLGLAGGKLWFAHSCQASGGTGSINLDGTAVTDQTTLPGYCPVFATTPGDPDLLATGDMGLSPTTLYVYDVSTGPPTLVKSVRNPGGAGNLRDLAFTPDGLHVLSASGAPYMIQSFLASDLTLAGTYPTGPYPIAVAVSDDGAHVAAGADASYDKDIFVFPVGDTTPVRSWDFDSTSKELVAGGLAFSHVAVGVGLDRHLRELRHPHRPRQRADQRQHAPLRTTVRRDKDAPKDRRRQRLRQRLLHRQAIRQDQLHGRVRRERHARLLDQHGAHDHGALAHHARAQRRLPNLGQVPPLPPAQEGLHARDRRPQPRRPLAQVRRPALRIREVAPDRKRQLPHAVERLLLRLLLHQPESVLPRPLPLRGRRRPPLVELALEELQIHLLSGAGQP